MSDTYRAIVDLQATPDEAQALARRVVWRLSEEGLIMPSPAPDATLGDGGGYRPGHRIADLYHRPEYKWFLTLTTNGMEVCAKPYVNLWGFTINEDAACPQCYVVLPFENLIIERFAEAASQFIAGNSRPAVCCPRCSASSAVQEWKTRVHLGFAYLAFQFWNWPPFDPIDWNLDIPGLISEELGHDVVTTLGRI
jgi:hypothetical protein